MVISDDVKCMGVLSMVMVDALQIKLVPSPVTKTESCPPLSQPARLDKLGERGLGKAMVLGQ